MGEVCCALLDRPVLHGVCDHVGGAAVKPFAELYRKLYLPVRLAGETCLHDRVVEHHRSEYVSYVFQCVSPWALSAETEACGNGVVEHQKMQLLLAVMLVNCAYEHTAGILSHHLAGGEIEYRHDGLAN